MNEFDRRENESLEQYKLRICSYKSVYGLTWDEVAKLVNAQLNENSQIKGDSYRKWYSKQILTEDKDITNVVEELDVDQELEDEKEKIKLRDERIQINSLIRSLAREDTLKEIAREVVDNMSSRKVLSAPNPERLRQLNEQRTYKKTATLCLGDWHYGLECDLFYNKYNPEVAKERVNDLLEQTIQFCYNEDISSLSVLNLGDLINGIIHLPLRINSRYDVITQSIHVAEILSEFLSILCDHVPQVNYMSVTDNHSRVNANKKESLQIESFARIIDWYVANRLEDHDNFTYIENAFGEDIAAYNTNGHKVVAVHGDKDAFSTLAGRLSVYTQYHADLVLCAHYHHFAGNEENQTITLCNGTLMGMDDYAATLRCNSTPSQLFIVHTPENVTYGIHRIIL